MDGAGSSNYDARIAEAWAEHFAVLPRRTRILDLCTGNGAIALIAAGVARSSELDFDIVGVDRADIDPPRFAARHGDTLNRIAFQGTICAEELPFESGGFGAVTSQYGIEYSSLDRSLAEAVRVLSPGGRLRFGMHAAEGTVVADTRRAIADADFMLEVDLPAKAARCFKAVLEVEGASSPEPQAVAAADASFATFQQGLGRVCDRLPRATDAEMMRHSAAVLYNAYENRASFPLPVLLDKAEEVRAEIAAHRTRQQALVDAAISQDELAEMAARLADLGMTDIRTGEQRAADEFLGHTIEARRSS